MPRIPAPQAWRTAPLGFGLLLVLLTVGAQGCRESSIGPISPTTSSCSLFGPPVSGLRLGRTGSPDLKLGASTPLPVTLDRPRIDCGRWPEYEKFIYISWTWNGASEGPLQPETGRHLIAPRAGPIDVTVESCQCALVGEPVWTADLSNLPNGHWEQRAWLSGPQTMTFLVRGTEAGTTLLFVAAFVSGPCGNIDCGPYAFSALSIQVLP